MSSEGFNEAEELWIKEQRDRAAKKKKRERREEDDRGSLSMNSLMDIMVIILVFLLKNYGDEPIKVVGADFKAPKSMTELGPEDMTTITVTQNAILVNDSLAVAIKDGAVDKSQKRDGEASLYIQPLFDKVTEAVKKKKQETQLLNQTYDPVVTVIADQTTPYRLVTEVMYTAGQAELSKFKFAVVKAQRSEFMPQ